MIVQAENSALNDALSQRGRALRAPAPELVKVDGRSLADLLAFAADYGALIHYYDLSDSIDGDWSAFFSGDPSIKLALRAALDLPDIETELAALLRALHGAPAGEPALAHWRLLEKLLVRLSGLLEPARAARASLAHALADLGAAQPHTPLAEQARRLAFQLGDDGAEQRLRHARGADAWRTELIALLDEFVASLIAALDHARAAAAAQLDASLREPTHPPQSGLWDAFAQLFSHAQARINHFPRALLTFYHAAVLRQSERVERPDQLVLTFTPSAGVAQASIAKGTAFLAGKDKDGQSIAYALDAALTVDAASVTALRTLTLAPRATVAAAQVYSGTVKLAPAPPAIAAAFPLFGANDGGADGALDSKLATLGFAVASPCLMLAGGSRTVTLGLGLAPSCDQDLLGAFGAYGLDAGGGALPALLAQLLRLALRLRYSSAAGWIDIPAYTVADPGPDGGPYLISFTLDADAAPWTALAAAPAPGDTVPDQHTPTLYASVAQQGVTVDGVTIYPYSVLACVALSDLSIGVGVDGLAGAQMAAPGKSFPLFGSPPVQNAAFAFSAPELFVKQVDSFTMTIDWSGLPVTHTGFSGYYQAYVIDADGRRAAASQFYNAVFTVGMNVVNPGAWQIDAAWSGYLFQTTAGVPLPVATAMPLARTALVAPVGAKAQGAYYNSAMSYVCLTLTQPGYAFGDILYAPNVMAASLQLTAAASACAQHCGQDGWAQDATAQLDQLATVCATTTDAQFNARIKDALPQVVAKLDGAGLNAIEAAIAHSDAAPPAKDAWHASLAAALDQPPAATLLRRIRRLGRPATPPATPHDNLLQWLSANGAALAASAPIPSGRAQALLAAGTTLLAAYAKAGGAPAHTARPVIACGVRDAQTALNASAGESAQDCVQKCLATETPVSFPNQPWLPMAAGVHVNYTAAAALPARDGAPGPALAFFQLGPFDEVTAVDWVAGVPVPLLAPLTQAGTLTIDLSAPAQDVSLLFQLAPPAGGWPAAAPALAWCYQDGSTGRAGWTPLAPYSDSTDGLRKSGIVRFVRDGTPGAALLRLQVGFERGDAAQFPLLAALSSNAASASWVGPGGAAELNTPLPPGTISKPVAALPGIGSIAQATASVGGRAQASGPAFEMWLAERLRHKDYGIESWDYASLVLAAYPSLWQVAVTPASDGRQARRPGHVWVVAVPGPDTPAIADPTIPSNDAQMLGAIGAYLGERISHFVELSVTNPPYQRLCVVADLIFTDADAVAACVSRLNTELVAFLSPWPPQGLGPRPDDYYTPQAVAYFIRRRPYVRGILSFELVAQGPRPALRPYYTTVPTHQLAGKSVAASELPRRPNLSLPARAATSNGATP